MMKTTTAYLFAILLSTNVLTAQKKQEINLDLTLDQAIELAQKQSIQSFKNKNMYLTSYWQFRTYRAKKLPSLSLNSSPIDYNRSATLRYNQADSTESYVPTDKLESDLRVYLSQNITTTGATITASSNFYRTENLTKDTRSYNTVPYTIGISQPLNGYNSFRWDARIEPLAFEKAKREFIQSIEEINIETSDYFFRLVSAEINLKIAETNFSNADTLFRIAKGRFEIGTVTQDELLDFELSFLNSKIDLTKAKLNLQQSRIYLNSYLGLEDNVVVKCMVPPIPTREDLNIDEVIQLAIDNNPQILGYQQQILNANRKIARTRSESGLNASIRGSFGINKSTNTFDDAYVGPYNDQQGLSVSLNLPIIDWGLRRGEIQMAKSERDVAEATVRQGKIDFEQNAFQQAMEYNLQDEQVEIAAKADTIAQLGYDVTKQRFMIDKVDVIKLNAARNSLDAARRNYIDAIRRYWNYYFTIRQLTLYDFEKKQPLMNMFDQLIEQQ